MAGGKIFINYRRDDSRADSGRLYDRLNVRYPNRVFRDVGSLEPGIDWHEAITRVLSSSDACVVVIGKNWLNVKGASGSRRLDDPQDTVRQEIVTALQRGMRVFPVLVGGAQIPDEQDLPPDLQPLVRRNALEITEQDWDEGFEKLAEVLDRILGLPPAKPKPARSAKPALIGAAALTAILVVGIVVYNATRKPPVTVIREDPAPTPVADNPPDQGGQRQSGRPSAATSTAPPHEARPASDQEQGPATELPSVQAAQVAPPEHATLSSSELAGSWRAVVTSEGQQLLEGVQLYPDLSFSATLNNSVAGVGTWRYDASQGIIDVSAVNFLTNGIKFACKFKQTGESPLGFAGPCLDAAQMTWTVASTREGGLSGLTYDPPRVDTSRLTMAEKQAFAQILSGTRCTCGCRWLTVLNCLRNDATCMVSPALAQTQLVTFLGITRR